MIIMIMILIITILINTSKPCKNTVFFRRVKSSKKLITRGMLCQVQKKRLQMPVLVFKGFQTTH